MSESITKLEAARRQLRMAIRLFFEEEDMLAVHTLVGAANGILTDIPLGDGKSKSGHNVLVSKAYRHFYATQVYKARNFLKHAKMDPAASLNFDQTTTVYWLCDAVWMLWKRTGKLYKEGSLFICWFTTHNPDVLDAAELPAGAIDAIRALPPAPFMRKHFLKVLANPNFMKE